MFVSIVIGAIPEHDNNNKRESFNYGYHDIVRDRNFYATFVVDG